MHLNYNTTVHLSADDCEKIIKDFIKKETGMDVTNMSFEVKKEICGIGLGEHECTNFKGITVRCDKLGPAPSSASSWNGEVDRQSGAFTQEEINNSTEWK